MKNTFQLTNLLLSFSKLSFGIRRVCQILRNPPNPNPSRNYADLCDFKEKCIPKKIWILLLIGIGQVWNLELPNLELLNRFVLFCPNVSIDWRKVDWTCLNWLKINGLKTFAFLRFLTLNLPFRWEGSIANNEGSIANNSAKDAGLWEDLEFFFIFVWKCALIRNTFYKVWSLWNIIPQSRTDGPHTTSQPEVAIMSKKMLKENYYQVDPSENLLW